jgi:hypothetical protein
MMSVAHAPIFGGACSAIVNPVISWPAVCRMSNVPGNGYLFSASTTSGMPCGEDAAHFTAHALRLFTWSIAKVCFLNGDRPAAGDARASMKSAGVQADTTDDDSRGASQYGQSARFSAVVQST